MSWEDQGRQHRGWFGHGTAVGRGTRNASFPHSLDDRIHAVAYGAIAALPVSVRARVERQYQHGALSDLREAMTTWTREPHLDQATFAGRFLGRAANDPVALSLRSAAQGVVTAINHDDIQDAASHLAGAIQGVGVGQWPRFIASSAAQGRTAESGYGMEMPAHAPAYDNQRGPNGILFHKAQLVMPVPPPPAVLGLRSGDPSRAAARYLTQGWKAVTEAAKNAIGSIVSAEPKDWADSVIPDNIAAGRTTGQMRSDGAASTAPDPIILNNQTPGDKPATAPTGRKEGPITVAPGTNQPTKIGGRIYTGHSLDRMQGRGVTPSAVEDAINNGEATPGNTPDTTVHTGRNGVVVVTGSSGQVITVIRR